LDSRARICGFASRIRDGGHVVEAEGLSRFELRFGHHPVIARVLAVGHAEYAGGEHHGNGHDGNVVGRFAGQKGEDALAACHRASSFLQPEWFIR